jgi:NhaP-type Na+/H+ or K+/H+ antiporter
MEQIGSYPFIIGASIVVLLSFLFSEIAKKTNIPAVLMLIALGVFVQYLFKYLGISDINFFPILEVLGIVGLIMIVLEAALELQLKKEKIGIIFKSLFIALLGLLGAVFVSAFILYFLIGDISWLQSLLYATPISILSSAIIIPSVGNLTESKKEFHIYESTFSDILGIMLFYFLLGVLKYNTPLESGEFAEGSPTVDFLVSLGVTVIVSIVSSYVLLALFQKIKSGAKLFLLISILLLLYSVGKMYHLSPLIIILVFGLVVSNHKLFFRGFLKRLINNEQFHKMEQGLHIVTVETAFVVRTFFFVIFGASILLSSLLSPKVIYVSIFLLASIYAVRWVFLYPFYGKDLTPQIWIAPRGLITVLLFYAIPAEYATDRFDSGILLFIIIATGLIMTYGMIKNARDNAKPRVRSEGEDFTFDEVPVPELEIKIDTESDSSADQTNP